MIKNKKESQKFFKKNNYMVVKGAIDKNLVNFIYAYFQNKRSVAKVLLDNKYLSPFDESWGTFNDKQIPNTYAIYGDVVMETLMERVKPTLELVTGLELVPTYSYARIYKYGDILHRHKDRDSCEISTTINLGGDLWPIFLEPSGETNKPGVKVDLEAGDLLVYAGCEVEHWREAFEGYDCGQVFCHFNDVNGPFKRDNANDGRPMIGIPADYKRLCND
tara:strand:- start:31 stop:687 length:657 start_codon:yes stop_codon:yes gene_type:complete